ncbi:hypothetical protein H0H93_014482, partial [Arthromyces matolae]
MVEPPSRPLSAASSATTHISESVDSDNQPLNPLRVSSLLARQESHASHSHWASTGTLWNGASSLSDIGQALHGLQEEIVNLKATIDTQLHQVHEEMEAMRQVVVAAREEMKDVLSTNEVHIIPQPHPFERRNTSEDRRGLCRLPFRRINSLPPRYTS